MSETVAFRLGAQDYRAPHLNIGELRQIAQAIEKFMALEQPRSVDIFEHNVTVARIVLKRAEPAITDVDALECSTAALREATDAVLRFSGLESPGKAQPDGG